MNFDLSVQQKQQLDEYRHYVDEMILPRANQFDEMGCMPRDVIDDMASRGYLGALLPESVGGMGLDMTSFGILSEELGRGCSSIRSLLTVHSMASFGVNRWGSKAAKERWLPRLASGEAIGVFGLSEPSAGSDPSRLKTVATKTDGGFLLNGTKKWITFGQIADVILAFAKCDERPVAFLVEAESEGVTRTPINGMLGTTASMVAKIEFDDCFVPDEHLIGAVGFGLTAVGLPALDIGRLSVASGSVGIAQACLDASVAYVHQRKQGGEYIKEYQLIQQLISNMATNLKAARLLCQQAAHCVDQRRPNGANEMFIAKYFASVSAMQAATDTVQIHGAHGCSRESSAQRLFRDAKVMEIIEGSTQIQQQVIAQHVYQTA